MLSMYTECAFSSAAYIKCILFIGVVVTQSYTITWQPRMLCLWHSQKPFKDAYYLCHVCVSPYPYLGVAWRVTFTVLTYVWACVCVIHRKASRLWLDTPMLSPVWHRPCSLGQWSEQQWFWHHLCSLCNIWKRTLLCAAYGMHIFGISPYI